MEKGEQIKRGEGELIRIANRIWLEGKGERGKKEKEEERIQRVYWSEETRKKFRERTKGIKLGEGGVDEKLEKLVTRIKEEVKVEEMEEKGRREEKVVGKEYKSKKKRWREH